ncbi:unnamed protein product [Prunus armeniaca]
MRSHGQERRAHDQGGGQDLPRFMGVTPPCFTIPNADLTTHLPRSDYPLAPIRLHHADSFKPSGRSCFSLDWPSRTPPINTKLKTMFKTFKHQTKSLPQSKLYFLSRSTTSVIASLTPYIIRSSLSEQRAGAPPKNPPPTPPLNGLIAQAVNLTAEIRSSLGHNRLIRSRTQNMRNI